MMTSECNVETTEQCYDQRPATLPLPRKRRANIASETVAVEMMSVVGRGYDDHRLEKAHGLHYGDIQQAHPKSHHGPGCCPRCDAA